MGSGALAGGAGRGGCGGEDPGERLGAGDAAWGSGCWGCSGLAGGDCCLWAADGAGAAAPGLTVGGAAAGRELKRTATAATAAGDSAPFSITGAALAAASLDGGLPEEAPLAGARAGDHPAPERAPEGLSGGLPGGGGGGGVALSSDCSICDATFLRRGSRPES